MSGVRAFAGSPCQMAVVTIVADVVVVVRRWGLFGWRGGR